MAKLVVVQGVGDGPPQFSLDGQDMILGRQPDVDLRLDAREVSRRHARITCAGKQYYLEDLGSSNGTFINSTRLQGKIELNEQDQIRIGPYLFRFEAAPDSEQELVIRASVTAHASNVDLYRHDAERKLQAVLEIAHQVTRSLDLNDILPRLLDHLMRLFTQADRALILMMEGEHLVVRAAVVPEPVAQRRSRLQPLSCTARAGRGRRPGRRGRHGRQAVRHDADHEPARHPVVPLRAVQGPRRPDLGVLQLDSTRIGFPFTEDDLHLLTAVSLQASTVMENAGLHIELIKKERMEHDLALAREIQEGFLPQEFDSLASNVELFARVYPALEVCGDFYDFQVLDDGRLAFTVADVSGKGMPAASS